MFKTKNDCVHKINGQSLLVVISIDGNKYKCKCSSCQEIIYLKKKQIPTDIKYDIDDIK